MAICWPRSQGSRSARPQRGPEYEARGRPWPSCRMAGADEALIPQWIQEGRRRAEAAKLPPLSQRPPPHRPERVWPCGLASGATSHPPLYPSPSRLIPEFRRRIALNHWIAQGPPLVRIRPGGEHSGPRPPYSAHAATVSNGLCDEPKLASRYYERSENASRSEYETTARNKSIKSA